MGPALTATLIATVLPRIMIRVIPDAKIPAATAGTEMRPATPATEGTGIGWFTGSGDGIGAGMGGDWPPGGWGGGCVDGGDEGAGVFSTMIWARGNEAMTDEPFVANV